MSVGALITSTNSVEAVPSALEPDAASSPVPHNETVAHHIPAGWYPDRENPARRRWWNGTNWTDFYAASTIGLATEADQVIPALHSSETTEGFRESREPASAALSSPAIARPVPAVVVVLLTGLAILNAVLVSLFILTR